MAGAGVAARELLQELERESMTDTALRTALDTLLVYARNVETSPDDTKRRRINLSNKAFLTRLGLFPAGRQLMALLGFDEEDGHLVLPEERMPCREVLVAIKAWRARIDGELAERIVRFRKLTGVTSDVAEKWLQDYDLDVKKALEAYERSRMGFPDPLPPKPVPSYPPPVPTFTKEAVLRYEAGELGVLAAALRALEDDLVEVRKRHHAEADTLTEWRVRVGTLTIHLLFPVGYPCDPPELFAGLQVNAHPSKVAPTGRIFPSTPWVPGSLPSYLSAVADELGGACAKTHPRRYPGERVGGYSLGKPPCGSHFSEVVQVVPMDLPPDRILLKGDAAKELYNDDNDGLMLLHVLNERTGKAVVARFQGSDPSLRRDEMGCSMWLAEELGANSVRITKLKGMPRPCSRVVLQPSVASFYEVTKGMSLQDLLTEDVRRFSTLALHTSIPTSIGIPMHIVALQPDPCLVRVVDPNPRRVLEFIVDFETPADAEDATAAKEVTETKDALREEARQRAARARARLWRKYGDDLGKEGAVHVACRTPSGEVVQGRFADGSPREAIVAFVTHNTKWGESVHPAAVTLATTRGPFTCDTITPSLHRSVLLLREDHDVIIPRSGTDESQSQDSQPFLPTTPVPTTIFNLLRAGLEESGRTEEEAHAMAQEAVATLMS